MTYLNYHKTQTKIGDSLQDAVVKLSKGNGDKEMKENNLARARSSSAGRL